MGRLLQEALKVSTPLAWYKCQNTPRMPESAEKSAESEVGALLWAESATRVPRIVQTLFRTRGNSLKRVGDRPNTVPESTVSNTELSEFFCPHRVPGTELNEFLSAYYLCAKANSPSFSQNSPSLPQNSVRLSEFSSPKQYSRNSIPPGS